ncbi:hypothetical protein ACFTRD_30480 [Paenibacillus sp. NPDC056933]|uniref:hypothetical protein n=1 Tax=Paenibacillus sp. NPDC056933 TaxID=3345968 RepID=UPI0036410D81
MIRITGRVSHEVLNNGGGNWDAEYRKMLDALTRHLGSGAPLAPVLLQEAAGPVDFAMDRIMMRLLDYASWRCYGCLLILSPSRWNNRSIRVNALGLFQ